VISIAIATNGREGKGRKRLAAFVCEGHSISDDHRSRARAIPTTGETSHSRPPPRPALPHPLPASQFLHA